MADTKITALAAITTVDPAADVLPIVDISDTSMAASGTTKKITSNQILGAGGTATLASATITGDLTVDTSTMKVDSANNRVGILTASPAAALHVNNGNIRLNDGYQLEFGGGFNSISGSNASNYLLFYINNSEAMRLNSTGLGVGASPTSKLTIGTGSFSTAASGTTGMYTTASGLEMLSDSYFFGSRSGGGLMTLNSSGNVGIGVTPSAWQTGLKALQFGGNGVLYANGGNSAFFGNNFYTDSAGTNRYLTNTVAAAYGQVSGAHQWFTAPTGTAGNPITGANAFVQTMTLDASGRLLVGATSAVASGSTFENLGTARQVLTLKGNDATSYTLGLWSATTTGDNFFAYFGTEASTTVRGSVTYNRAGGLVAYNTTSDYRAKDIIGPVSNSGSLIDSLKVYVGKMHGATIERPMLVAHEAQEVAPYAVSGTKDEVDAEGKPKYQQMDASALVPLLIAEIQSLRARVQTLEAK